MWKALTLRTRLVVAGALALAIACSGGGQGGDSPADVPADVTPDAMGNLPPDGDGADAALDGSLDATEAAAEDIEAHEPPMGALSVHFVVAPGFTERIGKVDVFLQYANQATCSSFHPGDVPQDVLFGQEVGGIAGNVSFGHLVSATYTVTANALGANDDLAASGCDDDVLVMDSVTIVLLTLAPP